MVDQLSLESDEQDERLQMRMRRQAAQSPSSPERASVSGRFEPGRRHARSVATGVELPVARPQSPAFLGAGRRALRPGRLRLEDDQRPGRDRLPGRERYCGLAIGRRRRGSVGASATALPPRPAASVDCLRILQLLLLFTSTAASLNCRPNCSSESRCLWSDEEIALIWPRCDLSL